MEERFESWVPHLLGFILPIVTIAGLYQGGWWTVSGFVWALGIGPILDYFSPEGIPKRNDGFSTRPWNMLLFGHSLTAIAAIRVSVRIGAPAWIAAIPLSQASGENLRND